VNPDLQLEMLDDVAVVRIAEQAAPEAKARVEAFLQGRAAKVEKT
jgi:hypothetical protein